MRPNDRALLATALARRGLTTPAAFAAATGVPPAALTPARALALVATLPPNGTDAAAWDALIATARERLRWHTLAHPGTPPPLLTGRVVESLTFRGASDTDAHEAAAAVLTAQAERYAPTVGATVGAVKKNRSVTNALR